MPPHAPPSPCPTAGASTVAPGGWDGRGCLLPPPGGPPGTGATNSSCASIRHHRWRCPPPRRAKVCPVRSCQDKNLMCGVGPPWSLRRHPSEAPSRSSLRCALRAPRGASRGTQACGGQPRIRHQLQAHRPREVVQAGLSLPRSMWGVHSATCIGSQTPRLASNP
jgi:hypothetical protein